jgi:UDP-N-acetylglucosamine--N-acetylmuramyl-(pentapeptide) pyrophosphoryl-undecaprenol N-acetylglucosamine transferase
MAGGTGGHVFPALAVAEYLRGRGFPLLWLGTSKGLEWKVVPKAGFRLLTIGVSGLRGKALVTRLKGLFSMAAAFFQALGLFVRHRPAAVLGMGGFVSGPGGMAAWLLRIPLLIHEQNAIAGYTNTLLSRLAARVMEAFPGTFPPSSKAIHTGNPVRGEITGIPAPSQRFSDHSGAACLLVVGGSLGAEALNHTLPGALARLSTERPRVWHQCGAGKAEDTSRRYAAQEVEARVESYIENMAEAYAWADLVVCRAGALTIAELAAAGVGAVLVPYPFAVDDHQTANGRYLADAGAAILVPQTELTAERLAGLLDGLLGSRERLRAMAEAARGVANPDATRRVAELCLEAAYG